MNFLLWIYTNENQNTQFIISIFLLSKYYNFIHTCMNSSIAKHIHWQLCNSRGELIDLSQELRSPFQSDKDLLDSLSQPTRLNSDHCQLLRRINYPQMIELKICNMRIRYSIYFTSYLLQTTWSNSYFLSLISCNKLSTLMKSTSNHLMTNTLINLSFI